MIWPHYKSEEMENWLRDHNCEPVDFNDECLDQQLMTYQGPTGALVPVQIMKVYPGYYISKVCTDLGIPVPQRFIDMRKDLDELRKKQAEKLRKQRAEELAKLSDPPPLKIELKPKAEKELTNDTEQTDENKENN